MSMASQGILANAHDFSIHQPTMIDQSNTTHITQEVIFNRYACESGRVSPINVAAPCSSQLFTGYDNYLEMLRIRLLDVNEDNSIRKYFLLYGMRGVGKTQICLKFKDKMEDYFKFIFWIDSTSEDSIVQSLRSVFKAYNPAQTHKFSPSDVLTWISFLKCRWLMIFDNADGPPEFVEKYIPAGSKGAILITSRNHELRRITTNKCSAEVSGLCLEASVSLLLKASGLEEDASRYETAASEIVSELCYLPLAITQAGAYIMGGSCDITEYLAIYRMHRTNLLSRESFGSASKYAKSVYGTWEISFQKLLVMANDPDSNKTRIAKCAIKIINVSCFLHHRSISTSIFERAARYYKVHVKKFDKDIRPVFINTMNSVLFDTDETGEWNKFVFYEAISILMSLSLIKKDDPRHFTLHPLVKNWCQDRLPAEERNYWILNSEGILAASITNDDSREEYIYNQDILLHILAILSRKRQNGLGYHYDVIVKFANALGRCGRHITEEQLRRDMLKANKELLGDKHPSTLKSMTDLAIVLSDLEKWKDAEELELEVLKMTVTVYGREHPKTLRSMAYLAITYSNLGKWELAEKLDLEVFKTRIKKFGEDHPDTIQSMASLAVTYSEIGMWEKAQKLEENVFDILTRLKGVEHSDTLRSMTNLSATYSNLGKWVEAEKLQIQILECCTRIFGDDHPNTVQSMAYLAASYSNLGKWEMAERLQKKVLELRTKIYGEDHLNTLRSMSKLGRTYCDLGKYVKAEEILTNSLERMAALYGEDHYETNRAIANLARNYSDIWKWKEAEKLQVRVLEIRLDTLGEEHFTTLRSMANLARTYSHQGKWDMAEALQVHVLERIVKIHGHRHPDVLVNMNQLGVIYSQICKVEEAQKLQLLAFREMAQALGEEHPDTLLCMSNLSNTYVKSKEFKKAELLQRHVIDISTRVYGDHHPLTLTSLYNMGYTYYSQRNNMQEAEKLINVALKGRLEIYGSEHPAAMECIEVLVGIRAFMDECTSDECRSVASKYRKGFLKQAKGWLKIIFR